MASLRNNHIGMEIGITPIGAFKQPALYIQEGNQKRVVAQFFSKDAAERFLKLLEKCDEAGGGDE